MLVRNAAAGGFIRFNEAFAATVGFSREELAKKDLIEWIDPKDRERLRTELAAGSSVLATHQTHDGKGLPLELSLTEHNHVSVVLARCAASAPERATTQSDEVATVSSTLQTIAHIVEEQNPGLRCSILLVEDGHFVRGAGPSLPEDYNNAVDGYAIGPTVGSCGTAIYWNTRVIVEDIQADPLWGDLKELAKKAGVAACWSHPFTSGTGSVLGALALYAPEPCAPTLEQLGRLRAAARMTGLAVERGRAEERLRQQRVRERELEEQLRQAAKMEALGVLAGGVAHDFNNVLATILANAEFALELLPPGEPARDMLEEIAAASKRAGGFCEQMLAYAGRGAIASSRFEVSALLGELSSLVEAALPKKVSLEYALHDKEIFVDGDPNQLLQVIMNLVTNAGDALGDNEGHIVVASTLEEHDASSLQRIAPGAELTPGEYLELSVTDNGCGMTEATMSKIFDPFFTTKFTGRGLGLAAAKGIIVNHGGTLCLRSEVGKGTVFTILIPASASETVAASIPTSIAPEFSRPHILLADDESGLRTILALRLRHSGFEVTEAVDGEEALRAFHAAPGTFDCVLLDLSMPKFSGEEVYAQIRHVRPCLPVVLMSGYAEQELIARLPSDTNARTLHKPIPAMDMLQTIHEAMTIAQGEGSRTSWRAADKAQARNSQPAPS